MSICELVIGILIFVDFAKFTSSIILVLGIILCVLALRCLFLYFRADAKTAVLGNQFLFGTLLLTAGVYCAVWSDNFTQTVPVLSIYGMGILLTGMIKLQETMNKLRLKYERWYISGISALLALVFSGIILWNPFSDESALWIFIGITLVVEALLDLCSVLFSRAVEEQVNPAKADIVAVDDSHLLEEK